MHESLHKFVGAVNYVVRMCNKSVEKIKGQQLKMVSLEKELTRQRSDEQSQLYRSWQHLAGMPESSTKQCNTIFQHILQHIWSNSTLQNPENTSVNQTKKVPNINSQSAVDDVERVAIRQHAGWAIKRARDTILSSRCSFSIKLSSNDSTKVEVSKDYLLKLIDRLGKDELQEPGKFLFMPFPKTDDFF